MNNRPKPTKWTAKLKRWVTQSPLPYFMTVDVVNRLARFNEWRKKHPSIPYFQHLEQLYTYLIDEIVCEVEIFGIRRVAGKLDELLDPAASKPQEPVFWL